MYKTNEEGEDREDLSVGEDLETFINDIKNGTIPKLSIWNHRLQNRKFLLCLLDREERKKLDQKDEVYTKTFRLHVIGVTDVPEAEWKESDSNLKFSLSYTGRETFMVDL